MAGDFAIKAVISVIDRITAPLRKIGAQVREKLGGSFSALGKEVGSALSKLGDWTTAATKAAFVGGALLTAGLFEAGKGYLETAGNLADMTAQLGVSAEFLQELRYAAKLGGIGAEELDGAISKLSLGMGQMRAGGGKLLGFLAKVSPSLLRQVKATKSNEEAFDLLFSAMDRIKDPAKRAAFAVAVFGKSGQSMTRLLADGTEGFAALRKEAEATGSVLSSDAVAAGDKLGDTIDHLKTSLGGVIVSIASRLVPAIQPLVDKMIAWVEENRDLIALNFEKTIDAIAKAFASIDWPAVLDGAQKCGEAIKELWKMIGGASGATKVWAGLLAVDLLGSLAKLWPLIKAIGGVFVSVGGVILAALGNVVAFLALAAESIAAVFAVSAGAVVAAFALIPIAILLVWRNLADFAEFGKEFWRTLKVLWIDGTAWLGKLWAAFVKGWTDGWQSFAVGIKPLWDGIVSVIDAAWQRISTIVGYITGAVSTVIDKAKQVTDFLGITDGPAAPGAGGGGGGQVPRLAFGPSAAVPRGADLASVRNGTAGAHAAVNGAVTVRFDNAPPGLRVSSADASTPGMTLNTIVGRRTLASGVAL